LCSVSDFIPGTGFQSLIDFEIKIADRFLYENRIANFCYWFLIGIAGAIFISESGSDLKKKFADRF